MQMRYIALIGCALFIMTVVSHANEVKRPIVTIQTIDSDTLVSQFWILSPSPVEAIVLKRRQRAKK